MPCFGESLRGGRCRRNKGVAMLKTAFSLALFGASLALATPAQATITFWDGTGANDEITWGQLGPTFTVVNTPQNIVSTLGLTGSVVDENGVAERRDQGNGWAGNFGAGEQLLWNQVTGWIQITFDTPVQAGGAQFQGDVYGPFLARIWTDDGSFFDVAGVSNPNGDDSAIFIGALSDTANIVSITFGMHDTGLGPSFAIGQVDLINPAIPEPATWAMMMLGFGVVGLAFRRSRRKNPTLAQLA
jgi:hypothetical protein